MNDLAKNLLLWLVIAVVLMAVFNSFSTPGAASSELTYNQFIEEVKNGRVSEVNIAEDGISVTGKRSDNSIFTTAAPEDPRLLDTLFENQVQIVQEKPKSRSLLLSLLFNLLPVALIIGFWFWMMRNMQ